MKISILSIIETLISLFLISIILLRVPKESRGLSSFTNVSNVLGSPGSAERFLDILTITFIYLYIYFAFQINNLQIN